MKNSGLNEQRTDLVSGVVLTAEQLKVVINGKTAFLLNKNGSFEVDKTLLQNQTEIAEIFEIPELQYGTKKE